MLFATFVAFLYLSIELIQCYLVLTGLHSTEMHFTLL